MPRFYTLIFLLMIFKASAIHAAIPKDCGLFELRGWVQKVKNKNTFTLNKGTRDALVFSVTQAGYDEMFLGKALFVKLVAEVNSLGPGRQGQLQIKKLSFATPDPLRKKHKVDFKLLRQRKCRKIQ